MLYLVKEFIRRTNNRATKPSLDHVVFRIQNPQNAYSKPKRKKKTKTTSIIFPTPTGMDNCDL